MNARFCNSHFSAFERKCARVQPSAHSFATLIEPSENKKSTKNAYDRCLKELFSPLNTIKIVQKNVHVCEARDFYFIVAFLVVFHSHLYFVLFVSRSHSCSHILTASECVYVCMVFFFFYRRARRARQFAEFKQFLFGFCCFEFLSASYRYCCCISLDVPSTKYLFAFIYPWTIVHVMYLCVILFFCSSFSSFSSFQQRMSANSLSCSPSVRALFFFSLLFINFVQMRKQAEMVFVHFSRMRYDCI